jgi:hypothetical protein
MLMVCQDLVALPKALVVVAQLKKLAQKMEQEAEI